MIKNRDNLIFYKQKVYQENIYTAKNFISMKKIVSELNSPVNLISYHSTSKGLLGECGLRGGYMELQNI